MLLFLRHRARLAHLVQLTILLLDLVLQVSDLLVLLDGQRLQLDLIDLHLFHLLLGLLQLGLDPLHLLLVVLKESLKLGVVRILVQQLVVYGLVLLISLLLLA